MTVSYFTTRPSPGPSYTTPVDAAALPGVEGDVQPTHEGEVGALSRCQTIERVTEERDGGRVTHQANERTLSRLGEEVGCEERFSHGIMMRGRGTVLIARTARSCRDPLVPIWPRSSTSPTQPTAGEGSHLVGQ